MAGAGVGGRLRFHAQERRDLDATRRNELDKGHERFLNEGRNERWREVLTPEDVARYEARAARELSPALANWLAKGRLIAGDPREAAD